MGVAFLCCESIQWSQPAAQEVGFHFDALVGHHLSEWPQLEGHNWNLFVLRGWFKQNVVNVLNVYLQLILFFNVIVLLVPCVWWTYLVFQYLDIFGMSRSYNSGYQIGTNLDTFLEDCMKQRGTGRCLFKIKNSDGLYQTSNLGIQNLLLFNPELLPLEDGHPAHNSTIQETGKPHPKSSSFSNSCCWNSLCWSHRLQASPFFSLKRPKWSLRRRKKIKFGT